MSDMRSRNSRYEETQIRGRAAENQLDDQVISTKDKYILYFYHICQKVDIAEEVVVKAAYLGRGHDGRFKKK